MCLSPVSRVVRSVSKTKFISTHTPRNTTNYTHIITQSLFFLVDKPFVRTVVPVRVLSLVFLSDLIKTVHRFVVAIRLQNIVATRVPFHPRVQSGRLQKKNTRTLAPFSDTRARRVPQLGALFCCCCGTADADSVRDRARIHSRAVFVCACMHVLCAVCMCACLYTAVQVEISIVVSSKIADE